MINYRRQFLCLSAVFLLVKSFQPNCFKENQFRSYCFSIEYCNSYSCGSNQCGIYPSSTSLVRIESAKIIPTCAFSNSDQLEGIEGVQKKIEIIAGRSFVNLPNIKNILLSFNLIRELHQGVFLNVSATLLDLSWNRLVYIDDGAFSGLNKLEYLNLSRNELKTLPNTPMPQGLLKLNLSYNFLDRILMNSKKTPDICDIDLSNNVLEKVAFSFENDLKTIDLSNNELKTLDFVEVPTCEELKIPSNSFSEVPEILLYLNIQRMSLYPNPWVCRELQKLWTHLQNNYVLIIDEDGESRRHSKPICQANFKAARNLSPFVLTPGRKICRSNKNCDKNMICRSNKCWDPCVENICGSNSVCDLRKHEFRCSCPFDMRKDPYDIYSACVNYECITNSDCDSAKFCARNNTCVQFPAFYPLPQYEPPGPNETFPVDEQIQHPDIIIEKPEPWWYNEIPKLVSSNIIKNGTM